MMNLGVSFFSILGGRMFWVILVVVIGVRVLVWMLYLVFFSVSVLIRLIRLSLVVL